MAFSWQQGNTASTPTSPKTSANFSWQNKPVVSTKAASLQAHALIAQNDATQANSFGTLVKETVRGATIDPLVNFAHSLWGVYQSTPGKLAEDVKAGSVDIQNGHVLRGITKVGFRAAGDAALAVFAPISSAIGAVLTASGGQQLTDKAGQTIADGSGITDLPAFQRFAMEHPNAGEDFNRLLTLFMAKGEKGQIDPVKTARDAKAYVNKLITDAQTVKLPVKLEGTPESKVNVSTPTSRQSDYATSQGYEPYVSPDQLPTIEMGARAKSSLPSIQIGEPSHVTKMGSLTVEPIKPQEFSWNTNKPVSSVVEPSVTVEPILPPRAPGVTKTASDINQNLVKQGFDALPVEEQAKYSPQSYKEIANHAASFLENDVQGLKDMMTGRAPLSLEVQRNPEIYHNTLEAYATKNLTPENVQLLQDLAKSPVSQTSRAAQVLGGHGFNDNPNSTVKALEELNTEFKAKIEKKSGKKYAQVEKPVIEEAKAAKASVKITPQTWADFIESVKCNY